MNWNTSVYHGSGLSAGRWYHMGVTYDNSDKSYRLRIWDDTAQAILGTDKTGTFGQNIYAGDAPFLIGDTSDGRYDEMVAFNKVLTTTEIDQVRQGTYTGPGQVQTITLQDITYNNRGQKATVRGPYPEDPNEDELAVNYTQYAYDALGRLWKVTDAEDHTTTTRYWPDNKVWRVIDANDCNSVVNTYYGNGSLKNVKDAKGNLTRYEYNGFMGLKKTIYEDDTYEEPTYDEYRRVVQARGRSGQEISLTYDAFGRLHTKTVVDANDLTVNTIHYRYDISGKLTRTIDNTGTTRNIYDSAGRLIRVVYPGDMSVAYEYDACGNRTKLTYPDSSYVSYEYDGLNRLKCVRDSAGTVLAQYSYDGRSRRTGLAYPNGTGIAYNYDAASRLLAIDNQTGSGQYQYAYTYDKVGNRMDMTVTDPGGVGVHLYEYDNLYQVTEVDYPDDPGFPATDTTFSYDDAGNRLSVIDGSGTCNYTSNSLNQYTAAGGVSYQYDTSGNMTYDGHYAYGYDPENRLTKVRQSGQAPVVDALAQAVDSPLSYDVDGARFWRPVSTPFYWGWDSAQSGPIVGTEESIMTTEVEGEGTFSFWWKVSSESGADYLEFYIDDVLQDGRISGEVGWEQKTFQITGEDTHTLKWRYSKDSSVNAGSDCGWVDYVRWNDDEPPDPPSTWTRLTYLYDSAGRRIEKRYDGSVITRFLYDGDNCIAEYDASNNLRRKYVFGSFVDQPICMIEAAQDDATYYYHFDGLGSVIALTEETGDVAQFYEYSIYGQVAASDPSHPNRFLFTGREFDKETGLYYYRARYYNAEIGRFLQTDPLGYQPGMNLYRYCLNGPTNWVDPIGLEAKKYGIRVYLPTDGSDVVTFGVWDLAKATLETEFDFVVAYDVNCYAGEEMNFMAALATMYRLPTGKKLVEDFAGKNRNVNVYLMDLGEGVAGETAENGDIWWNPYSWKAKAVPTDNRAELPLFEVGDPFQITPPWLVLAEELIHNWQSRNAGQALTREQRESQAAGWTPGAPFTTNALRIEARAKDVWQWVGWTPDRAQYSGGVIKVPMLPNEPIANVLRP